MNKDEALLELLKGLRIVFNNASAYSSDHPYFKKSIEEFKAKLENAFQFIDPLRIDVGPDFIFFDNRKWDKQALSVELAGMLHYRKIKSIVFKKGATLNELVDLLAKISLPVKEILRRGGIRGMGFEGSASVFVDELDYSELLKEVGDKDEDVWMYLLKATLEEKDETKIIAFAQSFNKFLEKVKGRGLFENAELKNEVQEFLSFLKGEHEELYRSCSKLLLASIMNGKSLPKQEELDTLNLLFKDLNKDDIVDVLSMQVAENDNFDFLSLTVFSRIFDPNSHKEIAPLLSEKLKATQALKDNPRIRKKVKELFFSPQSSFIPEFYRRALVSISDDQIASGTVSFDEKALKANYRYMLLNLLYDEKNEGSLRIILECLVKEFESVAKENNAGFTKLLNDALDEKSFQSGSCAGLADKLKDSIINFVENSIFSGRDSEELKGISAGFKKSVKGFDFYKNKIFQDGIVNTAALTLMLRLFPKQLPFIYEELESKRSDIEFMERFIEGISGIDSVVTAEILKRVFSVSSSIVKVQVLKAMNKFALPDLGFLLAALRTETRPIRKEALLIIKDYESARRQALDILFNLPRSFGSKVKILISNIDLAQDADLREAIPLITALSKRRFFWNRNLRERAKEALRHWNVK